MPLPELTSLPRHHPDSCPSLSTTLLRTLSNLLPRFPALILSIGSGSGLLEYLLLHHNPPLNIAGVEVSFEINKYLPASNLLIVNYTSALCPAAKEAEAWLFVYPRDGEIVERYLREYGGERVQVILFIVPQADYADIVKRSEALQAERWHEEVISEPGLVKWEVLVCFRRGEPAKGQADDTLHRQKDNKISMHQRLD